MKFNNNELKFFLWFIMKSSLSIISEQKFNKSNFSFINNSLVFDNNSPGSIVSRFPFPNFLNTDPSLLISSLILLLLKWKATTCGGGWILCGIENSFLSLLNSFIFDKSLLFWGTV